MKSKFTYAIITFIVSLTILVILSLNFQVRIRDLVDSSDNVEQSNETIIWMNRLELLIKEAESSQRGFLLTGDSSFLIPYYTFSQKIIPAASRLQELTKDNIPMQNQVIKLRGYISRRMQYMHFSLQAYKGSDSVFTEYFTQGKLLMDTCDQLLNKMEKEEQQRYQEKNREMTFYAVKTPKNFRLIFLLSLLFLIVSFILIMREIVQRSRYQQELQASMIELKQTYEELQQVTFITSHDFQEPLRKIRIFSDRLAGKHLETKDEELLMIIQRIQFAAGKIQELMNEMVHYMNLSRSAERMERIDFSGVINEALNDYSDHPLIRKARIEINVKAGLRGYHKQVKLLFKCLIDNAIKYSDPDRQLELGFSGTTVQARNEAEHSGALHTYYRVSVSDNGIGFEQEFSRNIFRLFKRLNNSETTPEGKGVGLALAEKIMANHHGYISAEGHPGEGAVFHLFFPVAAS